MQKHPLKDILKVLLIPRCQAEGEKTETKTAIWHSPLCDDGMGTVNSFKPKFYRCWVEPSINNCPGTCDFVAGDCPDD